MSYSPVRLSHQAYEHIRADLMATHGTRILITWVCKEELGFTFREHQDYRPGVKSGDWRDVHSVWIVDFYNEAAETMFRLRYL